MRDDAAQEVLSQIGRLTSCNKSSREKALRIVLEWLPSQPNLTDDVMKKLWNGLFFCVWFVVRHRSLSHNIIDRLSSLLPRLRNSSVSLHYFSTFLLTVRQDWCAVNAPRLDTFYLLIRRFLHHSFAFLKIHSWDMELTSRLISILEDACFLVREGKFEVSYHIASVFLEELRPFLPLRPEVLEVVFKPFISVMGSLPDKVLLGNIKSNMFDVLLKMGNKLLEVKKLGDEVNDDDDAAVVLGRIALTMGFSNKFFELTSSVDCCKGNMNRNRKVLFVLYEQFLKLEKDAAEAGLDNDVFEDVASACELPKTKVNGTVSKKRKRAKTINGQNPELNIGGDAEGSTTAKSGEKRSGGSELPGTGWATPEMRRNSPICAESRWICDGKVFGEMGFAGAQYSEDIYCHKMSGTKHSDDVYSLKMIGTKYSDGFYYSDDLNTKCKESGAKYSDGFYCSDNCAKPELVNLPLISIRPRLL